MEKFLRCGLIGQHTLFWLFPRQAHSGAAEEILGNLDALVYDFLAQAAHHPFPLTNLPPKMLQGAAASVGLPA